jgi:hypothetical protein
VCQEKISTIKCAPKWKKFGIPDLENDGDIGRAWDTITENIQILAKESISHSELKHNKLRFEEVCSKLVDWKKQAE